MKVRREKISKRMKILQDLVPGCSKIAGKAGMLDEIINYVQSLQRQVEVISDIRRFTECEQIIHHLTYFTKSYCCVIVAVPVHETRRCEPDDRLRQHRRSLRQAGNPSTTTLKKKNKIGEI